MGWKFWEREKSEAERSLERLQAGSGSPTADAGAGGALPAREAPAPPVDAGPADPAFRMPVEDVFTITGRGTVVTGRIEAGSVAVGHQVTLTAADGSTRPIVVTGVEMFRKVVDRASAGENVGLLLRQVRRDEVARGDVLTG